MTFFCCEELESITIPDSIKEIDKLAFTGCRKLTSIEIPTDCKVADNAFDKNTKVIRRESTINKMQIF